MYNINKRAEFTTVGDLRKLLVEAPDKTPIYICGAGGWFHIEEDKSYICLDCEDLEDEGGIIMETITITFDGDSVVVTDGRHTSESHFGEITDIDKRAFVALADFFGYEPAYLFNFDDDENFEEEF